MHLGSATQAKTQTTTKAPSRSTATQNNSTSDKRWERPLPKSGWDFSMLISRSMGRLQRAWGSICIPTGLGSLWINDVTVKRNDDTGELRTSLPFKAKPNRKEGGSGEMISHKGEQVYVVTGPKSYDNAVNGPGAMKASRLFMLAYDTCSQCAEMRDVDPELVQKLEKSRISLSQEAAGTTDAKKRKDLDARIADVDRQIERLNKRCHSSNKEWTVTGESNNGDDSSQVSCSCAGLILAVDEATEENVEALASMVNSVLDELTAPEVVEEREDEEDEGMPCPY